MTTELSKEYGEKILPYLIQAAKSHKTITYKDLAAKIGAHHRAMGNALGYVRDEICIPKGLPMITSIVVNGNTGLPGESWLPEGTSTLSDEEYKQAFFRFRDQVMAYHGWDALLKELDLPSIDPTIEDLDERGRAYSEYLERTGISEDDDHNKLKEYIVVHPEAIGLPAESAALKDYRFVDGDRAEIVFGAGPDSWAVVEIKNTEIGELVKGVYQAIKYRSLLQAEKGHGLPIQVDTILVAYEIPMEVSLFAAKMGVRCRIIHHEDIEKGSQS